MPRFRKLTGAGKFEWTDLHKEEFERVKDSVRDQIKLLPFNINKPMHLHIDASQEELHYLLFHPIEEDKEDSY